MFSDKELTALIDEHLDVFTKGGLRFNGTFVHYDSYKIELVNDNGRTFVAKSEVIALYVNWEDNERELIETESDVVESFVNDLKLTNPVLTNA